MTLKDVLHRRDDALMEILDRLKGKKLYNNLCVQLKFFWQDTKREIYCATPWKDAQGDDLPEIDREVVVLIKYDAQRNIHDEEYPTYRVGFGHRPNPNGWDGKNIDTNEVTHYTPKLYDKGGWNAPNIVYWLDARLPYEENKITKQE